MNSTPELTQLQRDVLTTMAVAQAAGTALGPGDLVEATGASEAEALRVLADLVDAGMIGVAGGQDPAGPDDLAARRPRPHRVVLVALMTIPEATPDDLADALGGTDAAAVAIADLTAAGMVAPCGEVSVCHTDTGWEAALAEVEVGPAAGDPLTMRLTYNMLATLRRRAEAQGETLGEFLAAAVMTP